jgi:hypothetical protein
MMRPVITPYRTLTFGVLPVMLDILLGWVTIQNYAFMSVHGTIQVKSSFIGQTHGAQKNPITLSHLQYFLTTSLFYSDGRLVRSENQYTRTRKYLCTTP